jgi:hypothetical protein
VLRNVSSLGNIAFGPKADLAIPSGGVRVVFSDLDGDGKLDIVATAYTPATVSVIRNVSTVGSLTTSSFAPRIDFGLGGSGHTPGIADLDGDGKPDLAVVTELSSIFSVFRNVSTPGTFSNSSLAARVDFSTGYNAWGLSIGDLDGDGRPDAVFCNQYDNTLSIYRNQVGFAVPPVITSQPTNQVVPLKGSASFSVVASGSSPLSYQWSLNGTNIIGATNSVYAITNVQFTNAGNYAVTVTNAFGSTISSNAELTVISVLDHFAWAPIPSPRFVNAPFGVTIQALDATNGVFTNFSGTVLLSDSNGVPVNPSVSGNFVQGTWTGSLTIYQAISNLVLQANDGAAHIGAANSINVISAPSLGMTPSGSNLLIFWPLAPSGFVLESSADLESSQWLPVTPAPVQIGNQNLELIQPGNTNQFFRLRYTLP